MESNNKDLLFYSNFCDYCKTLLNTLIKKNIRDNFLLICVDRKDLPIPNFVDRVPLILTIKKEVFVDDAIQKYIDLKTNKTFVQEEIAPFMFEGGINSSQYTFITNDGNSYDNSSDLRYDMLQSQNFVMLGNDQKISAPVDKEADSKSSKFDSALLEKYMNMRAIDDDRIKKLNNNNNGVRM